MLLIGHALLLALVAATLGSTEYAGEDQEETAVEEPNVEEFYVADEMNAMCEKNVRGVMNSSTWSVVI